MTSSGTDADYDDEELSVASLGDLQNVMEISGDVYDGVDYLAHSWPHDVGGGSEATAFLYKVRGQLVGFAATKAVDGGEALMVLASRVKPSFQGRGVYSRLRHAMFQWFRRTVHSAPQLYPRLQREVMTVSASNLHDKRDRLTKAGWRETFSKHVSLRVIQWSNLQQWTVGQAASGRLASRLTTHQVQRLLEAPSSHWLHLFPHQRIVADWKVFSVMPENLSFFNTTGTNFYATERSDEHEFSMLSCGTWYPCDVGICYMLDVFGRVEDSRRRKEEVKDHFNAHLQCLQNLDHHQRQQQQHNNQQQQTKHVILYVYSLDKLDDVIDDVTTPLTQPCQLLCEPDPFRKMHIMERQLTGDV